jgi:signal transduction histidine kinase
MKRTPTTAATVASLTKRLQRMEWIARTQAQLAELEFDLDRFMGGVVDRIPEMTPADGVVVELADGDEMVYRAASQHLAAFVGLRLKRAGSLSGLCVERSQTLYANDTETDSRVDREACRRIGLRSMVCAPLIANGEAVGALKVLSSKPDGFGADDIEVIELLGKTLAAALAKQVSFDALRAHEAALEEARREAETAAATKAEFLANMSHELRTPVTSIIGFAALAHDRPGADPLTQGYLERVKEAGQALLCLVNDVLDFSKLEAGQVSIEPRPTDVAALARNTLALFTPQAGAKDLTLSLDLADEALELSIDPDRIRQILLNLVGNAVKFTARGGVTLAVGYADGQLRINVKDTGDGIPAEKLSLLFQRFAQVDGSQSRASSGGTGLGLAICKGLVEAMGGRIGVESSPGQGSRFWFAIPAPVTERQQALEGEAANRPIAGLRVLVVDDHPQNRELARLFLGAVHAEVVEAADGAEAVRRAAEWPFDVILMDQKMPKLDGLGALRKIRSKPGLNDLTPVLAFTAEGDGAALDRLLADGFDGVVCKPIDPLALLGAVAKATAFETPAPRQTKRG